MNAQLNNLALKAPEFDGITIELKNATREKYADLIAGISLSSEIGQRVLEKLDRLCTKQRNEIAPWFALWKEHCDSYFDLPAAEEILSGDVTAETGTRLFLAHSYCKIVLSELVHLASSKSGPASNRRSLYDWVDCLGDDELTNLRAELRRHTSSAANLSVLGAVDCSDLLAAVYQELLPPPLRHLLGEYYTPSWLVEHCISHAESRRSRRENTLTIMDPAAGSGGFLAHYITHLSARRSPVSLRIVGFDVNPLAVDFCQANALLASS